MKKLLVTLMILGSTLAIANEDRSERRGGDRQPPQEAIDICVGQAADSTCQITTPHGDVLEGTCKYTPDQKYFVCMPERGPRGNK